MIAPEWITETEKGLAARIATLVTASPLVPVNAVYREAGYTEADDGAPGESIRLLTDNMPPDDEWYIAVAYYDAVPPPPGLDIVEGLFQVRTRLGMSKRLGQTVHGVIFDGLHEYAGPLGRARASLIIGGGLAYIGPGLDGRHEHTLNYRVRSSGSLDA